MMPMPTNTTPQNAGRRKIVATPSVLPAATMAAAFQSGARSSGRRKIASHGTSQTSPSAPVIRNAQRQW
jgi:hypothetical protein